MAKPKQWAEPDSILGQLQRGRGEGYLRALSAPNDEASEYLSECIISDPRLDGQVERRAEYYASIAAEVTLDLVRIAKHLREHDDPNQRGWNTTLAVETIAELAKRKFDRAPDILCDYIKWGSWWDWALEGFLTVDDPGLHAKVAVAIEGRFPTDEKLQEGLADAVVPEEYFGILGNHSARIGEIWKIQKAARTASVADSRLPVDLTSLTTKQLLKLAEVSEVRDWPRLRKAITQVVSPSDLDLLVRSVSLDKPSVAAVALSALARLAPAGIVGWLRDFWSSNPKMPGFLRARASEAMISLPPDLTLPLARNLLFHESSHECFLAQRILKAHATEQDIPTLRTAISSAMQDEEDNCYRLCDLTEAFLHLPRIGPVPELLNLYSCFRYSYGRVRAARALNVTSPDLFRAKFASECLWDCEEEARSLGASCAPVEQDSAAKRLRELASDVWESEAVRGEATKRLANI